MLGSRSCPEDSVSGYSSPKGNPWATGLDPTSRRQLWDLIRTFQRQGRTILLTTHYMDEAERLCDRVAIFDQGRVIAEGTPAELIARLGAEHIVEFTLVGSDAWLEKEPLAGLPTVFDVQCTDQRYVLHVAQPHLVIPALIQLIHEASMELGSLATRHASLEDVFVHMTGRTLEEEVGVEEST